jgi:hypothetical protein
MNKDKIYIEFSNGEIWSIEADAIARKRADYFACEVDGFPPGGPDWAQEYEYSISKEGEEDLIDFLKNNVNWNEICNDVWLEQDGPGFDYSNDFNNAKLYREVP